jgi:hypothetical protein
MDSSKHLATLGHVVINTIRQATDFCVSKFSRSVGVAAKMMREQPSHFVCKLTIEHANLKINPISVLRGKT